MNSRRIIFLTIIVALTSCYHKPKDKDFVNSLADLNAQVKKDIGERINYFMHNPNDAEEDYRTDAVELFYEGRKNESAWCNTGRFSEEADSMFYFVQHVADYGLNPKDYFSLRLDTIYDLLTRDTMQRLNAALWSEGDVLMTDAFMKLCDHLHFGRLPLDTISLRKEVSFGDKNLAEMLTKCLTEKNIVQSLKNLEPKYEQYHLLKDALKKFKKDFAGMKWDSVPVNFKKDTTLFKKKLIARLKQSHDYDSTITDDERGRIKVALKSFQKKWNLESDGKVGIITVRALNYTVADRVKEIELNLDRWRQMPDSLGKEYVLVNLPGFYFELWDDDTMRLESKIICGKPKNPTPLLNSHLTDIRLYPYWQVPWSITWKEMIPAVQHDTGYLRKTRMDVIDSKGEVVENPQELPWKKFSKNYFPYKFRQREGNDNSLGIIMFNFNNVYIVYMHDTNARSLFGLWMRALSHGCVRVQKWEDYARWVLLPDSLKYPKDTLSNWFASGIKRNIPVKHRVGVYFRYFTCAVKDGKLLFFDDMYGYDAQILWKNRLQEDQIKTPVKKTPKKKTAMLFFGEGKLKKEKYF